VKGFTISVVVALLLSGAVHAQGVIVPVAYKNVAREYGIPYKLLYSIGLQESQRELDNGLVVPWPWTLNIRGEGQYFDTSMEMQAAAFEALEQGITNIDVGVLQVNWHWHGRKMDSIVDLIRPENNLNVGASILREEHRKCGGTDLDWNCAVGRYHSYKDERAEDYTRKVMRWFVGLL